MRDTFIADIAVLTKCMQNACADNKSAKAIFVSSASATALDLIY